MNGTPNFNSLPPEKVIERYEERNGSIGIGSIQKYLRRYSAFKLQVRVLGRNEKWKILTQDSIFVVKGQPPKLSLTTGCVSPIPLISTSSDSSQSPVKHCWKISSKKAPRFVYFNQVRRVRSPLADTPSPLAALGQQSVLAMHQTQSGLRAIRRVLLQEESRDLARVRKELSRQGELLEV